MRWWWGTMALALVALPAEGRLRSGDAIHLRLAGLDVAAWTPPGASVPEHGSPLIVFSHGFRGCDTQSAFLTAALAAAGYVVVAPNHRDAGCRAARGSWRPGARLRDRAAWRPEEPFRDPGKWSDATYRDRAADIRALLDAVLRDGTVAGVRVDPSRIGIAGHSLGGYTALGVGGAWPSWRDGRIRAVLALSPYAQPFLAGGGLAGLKVPVMYQGGTRDIGITPGVRKNAGAFDRTGGPKYYVEFEGTGHLGWTDLVDGHHDLMVRYALAFFDHVLRDRPEATLEEKLPGVSDLRADPGGPSSR